MLYRIRREEKARAEREAREKERKEKEERDRAEAVRRQVEERERKAKEEEARQEVARKEREAREAREKELAEKAAIQKKADAEKAAAAKAAAAAQLRAQKAATAAALPPQQQRTSSSSPRKASVPGSSSKSSSGRQQHQHQHQQHHQQQSAMPSPGPSSRSNSSMSSSLPPMPSPHQMGMPPVQYARHMPPHPQQQQQSAFNGMTFQQQPQGMVQGGRPPMGPGGYSSGVYGMGGPAPPGYPQAPASPGILRQANSSTPSPSRTSPPPHSSAATASIGMGFPTQPSRTAMASSSHDPYSSGPLSMASHSRQPSQTADSAAGPSVGSLPIGPSSFSGPSSIGSDFRAIQRPGPIGRPSVDQHGGLDVLDELSSIPSASTASLGGQRSPSPDNVFGSSALSPDDEIVPRRPSQHVAAPIWGGPAPGSSVGNSGSVGLSASSPWGAPSPPGTSALGGGGGASPFGTSPQPAAAALAPGSISGIWSSAPAPPPSLNGVNINSSATWGTPTIPSYGQSTSGRPDPFGSFGAKQQQQQPSSGIGSSLLSPPGRVPALFNLPPSYHQPPQPSR